MSRRAIRITFFVAFTIVTLALSKEALAASNELLEAQKEALACSERLLHAHAVIACEPVITVVGAALDGCGKSWLHAADIITPRPADLGGNDKVKKYLESLMSGFMDMRQATWPKLEAEATRIRKEGHLLPPGSYPLAGYVCMGNILVRKGNP